MEAEWPEIVRRFRAQALLLGLGPLLDGLVATRDGAILDVAGRIPETQTRIALAWAKALLPPRVPAPEPPDGGARDAR
jgi:hypothetical protein